MQSTKATSSQRKQHPINESNIQSTKATSNQRKRPARARRFVLFAAGALLSFNRASARTMLDVRAAQVIEVIVVTFVGKPIGLRAAEFALPGPWPIGPLIGEVHNRRQQQDGHHDFEKEIEPTEAQ
jgi:hypothetical protein